MAHSLSSRFGESRLRLLRVLRRGERHDPKTVTIALRFEGDAVLPNEPLKGVIYRVAREQRHDELEAFGLTICQRVLEEFPQIGLAHVDLSEEPWTRVVAGGKQQPQAFTPGGGERRVAIITSNGTRTAVTSGIDDLVLLRTGGLLPSGHPSSEETRADAVQPLLIAALSARWAYTSAEIAFATYRQGVRAAILETFAWHAAESLHHTLAAMADVILAGFQEIVSVSLTLRERPYRPVDDLTLESDAVFVAQDEPVAVTEIIVDRGGAMAG